MATPVKVVGVVGTGVIGASWTTLFLARGLKVIVSDPAPNSEQKLHEFIDKAWPLMKRVGLSSGASKDNLRFVDDVATHLDDIDFIQENAPERAEFKTKLIGDLDAKARPEVIIASSSSGIPSSQFISGCKKAPERILIGHPFNPPHLIPLVDIVPHPGTSNKVKERAQQFYTSLGKTPILIRKEVPGFVANRLQAALNNEAMALVQRGIVSAEDVDLAVTSSLGMRWSVTGPLMCNILGGGGGKDGFLKIQKSIGRAAQTWVADMNEHQFQPSDENLNKINGSVQEWIDNLDISSVESERDDIILAILDAKAKIYN